jgi:glycosyltransferase involved in cell wall biosynthesis
MAKRRVTIAANAVLSRGGAGLNLQHMLEGGRRDFEPTLFCRTAVPGCITHVTAESQVSKWIGRLYLVRRLHDWQNYFSDSHFDLQVAARLTATEIFHGVTGQCLESMRAARKFGAKRALDVVTMHIDDFLEAQERECAKFQIRLSTHPWSRDRILREYQEADVIRVMSERARASFLERGFRQERLFTVPPPIKMEEYTEATFDGPKFRVSFVGLIEPWKGFHYLIDAFNALRLPDSELILWGGPGSRSVSRYLREQMARNPRIMVRPVEVRRCYAEVYSKSSVLVHPSLSDGFAYVVAEAMASGIPVIVTEKTGAADCVIDGRNGYIVPGGDVDAIRDRLAYLAQHPALVKRMGTAARETARALTLDRFRARLLACWESRNEPETWSRVDLKAMAKANV